MARQMVMRYGMGKDLGILTYGIAHQSRFLKIALRRRDRRTVLRLAANIEQYSKHQLATAMRDAARDEHMSLTNASQVSEKPGKGLTGKVDQDWTQIQPARARSRRFRSSRR